MGGREITKHSWQQPVRRRGRFLHAGLLVLLLQGESYGYALVDRLSTLSLPPGTFAYGVVYRMLRNMEREGHVSSRWETSSKGPQRRLYRITPKGEEALQMTMGSLWETAALIQQLTAAYEQASSEQSNHDKIHLGENNHENCSNNHSTGH